MTTRIYSYNPYSASAKALADALDIKRIKHERSKFKDEPNNVVINWGSSSLPYAMATIINSADAIANVTNKLSFFELFNDGSPVNDQKWVVPFTTDDDVVREWLEDGKTVVARTKLTGHSGEGIVILEGLDAEIVEAPLYTLYVPKKEEYRVHCYRKQVENADNILVFDIQRKAKRADVPKEEANYRIRNLAGGFIYARQELDVPECVEDVALKVFEQTGLDFGAVDIIYQESKNKAFALEINTAPGLSGTTLEKYVQMFKELIGE